MATTEMDCGSTESKSEQGSMDPDSKYPLKVLYCGGSSNSSGYYLGSLSQCDTDFALSFQCALCLQR